MPEKLAIYNLKPHVIMQKVSLMNNTLIEVDKKFDAIKT